MKQISEIYAGIKNPSPNTFDYRSRRPVVKMGFNQFLKMMIANGNNVLLKRGNSQEFKIFEEDKPIIKQLYLYATCQPSCEFDLNKGIIFMGKYGTGKSILMEAFLRIFNQVQYSKNVRIIDSVDYVNLVSQNNNTIQDLRIRPLFIDDLGKEPKIIKVFGSDIRPIADLLPIRYHAGGITFFTSNFNLESFGDFYGKHIEDRLKEMCTFVTMTGESRRKQDTFS